MSRKRDEKRKKQKELARQMGVTKAEAGEHHYLQENERVTRPELRVVSRDKPGGLRGLLGGKEQPLSAAVYLVEASRKRLLGVVALSGKLVQLPKVSYSRPAHFVVVVFTDKDGLATKLVARGAELRLGDAALDDPAIASEAWESPRLLEVEGQQVAAASVRGVDRTTTEQRFPIGKGTAVVEVKV